MKIIDNLPKPDRSVQGVDIPCGTTFYGQVGGHPRMLMLKAFQSIIGLEKPGHHFWSCPSSSILTIDHYEPVEVEVRVIARI